MLGTIHGIAQSVSSASRTVGPVLGGWGYGEGLQIGVVGMVWWSLAVVACVGWCVSGLLREGNGHEILLDGEGEEQGVRDGLAPVEGENEGKGAASGSMFEHPAGAGSQGIRPGFVREITHVAIEVTTSKNGGECGKT